MNTTATSLDPIASQPVALPIAGSGSGSAAPLPGVASPTDGRRVSQLDAFAKRGGPDVAIDTVAGLVRVHAVFQMDPTTREMTVSVVDESGKLVRMIPADSVAQMIAAMAAYRGR